MKDNITWRQLNWENADFSSAVKDVNFDNFFSTHLKENEVCWCYLLSFSPVNNICFNIVEQ